MVSGWLREPLVLDFPPKARLWLQPPPAQGLLLAAARQAPQWEAGKQLLPCLTLCV